MGQGNITEAVIFFDQDRVVKEMMYPEFEAVLDGVVAINDFRNQLVNAAFVAIDGGLMIRSVVLFTIDFDEQGNADKDWNIPLQHLASSAGLGPDLGAGPIRLACRSQCPVSWHQSQMWDPDMSPEVNHLVNLKRAAERNSLGILVDRNYVAPVSSVVAPTLSDAPLLDDVPTLDEAFEFDLPSVAAAPAEDTKAIEHRLSKKYQAAHRNKVANLIKQQRLQITTLKNRFKEEMVQRNRHFQEQKGQLEAKLEAQSKEMEVQQRQNQTLKQTMRQQLDEFRRSREELTRQLKSIEDDEGRDLERIKAQYEAEMAQRLQAATAELQEQIEVRDVEMAYRNELDGQLQEELEELRAKVEELSVRQSEDVLGDLSQKGVVFVAYHPGVGHITIPLQDIPRYMSHTMAYVANKCFVSEEQYNLWLRHYEAPSCDARTTDGSRCGARLDRVDSPGMYVDGHSNHCEKHRGLSAVEAVRAGRSAR
ncbi:chromosome partitioning protein ParA [Aestuariirhabdus litorea]|uniref:Chromosome partitioning protein ParA n=1 Tax=Aestuariirhabdus litorea TaxID=2528527 RepID=A0A3P3VSF5_9GAMM|nr:chromosome partitioning protein ParA [Aestuariirhabdus litorea]RRJ84626.1 chromosome partitioning protein ParA [Aestuariirhabdus litorea]RWW97851.1 chromosome partitioning protein ParA [Endozoicomonadaceae bacterium GTF-13]